MNKFAAFFFAVLLGLPAVVKAYDDDPSSLADRRNLADRSWYGGRRGVGTDTITPIHYRPTQRYYGSGYTISYRYIPVYRQRSTFPTANNFRTEAFLIATDQIPSWGVNPPRLTVKDPKSAVPRTAVTSIVRKKPAGKTPAKDSNEGAPAIIPASAVSEATVPPSIPAEVPAKP